MSRSASANLKTHLAGNATTLAYCWHIVRTDATELFFTSHDEPIIYSGDTYTPSGAFSPSAVQATDDLSVDNLEVLGVLDSAQITESDLRTGKYTGATVSVFIVNYSDLTQGQLWIAHGTLGAVSIQGSSYTVELRTLTQQLQQTTGRRMMRTCDANLGDARCGVSLGGYTVTGAVTGVTSRIVFAVDNAPAASGGLFTFTSGANSGVSIEVYALSGSTITLLRPTPYDIAVTDTYSVYRGCDKLLATCRDTFSNVVNFRGFNDLAGTDKILGFT